MLIVYRMEFNKTRCSCSWNSDQNSLLGGAGVVGGLGLKGVGSLMTIWYEIDPLCMT